MIAPSTKHRIPREQAVAVANQLMVDLWPACQRLTIAGSIRRQRETVSDVELVAIPLLSASGFDLFGNPVSYRDDLHELTSRMRAEGTLLDRLDKNGRPAFGTKYKRLIFDGVPVDLFTATPENYGLILALRTGPAEFNLKLVQPRYKGGFLPTACRVEDGYIWCADQRIDTPEEIDVFKVIDKPYIDPTDRT